MLTLLKRLGLNRDSAVLWVGILGGLVGFLGGHFDLLHAAFPSLGSVWQARIELLSGLIGIASAYLRLSPLQLSATGDLAGARANPDRTLTVTGKLPMVLLALALVGTSACASSNVRAERFVRDSIALSEQHRCTVHAAPCLSDDQFRAVNAKLYEVANAGEAYTKVARAGTAKPIDALTFAAAVQQAVAAIAPLDPTGTVTAVLAKLTALLNKAGVQ